MADTGRDDRPDPSLPSLDAAVGSITRTSGLPGRRSRQRHGATLRTLTSAAQDRQSGAETLGDGGPGEENCMVRDEASGPAGHQLPQEQNGRALTSRARQPDRQAGHGAGGRRGGAQAQLGRSDACRQDRQSGTEALEGSGPREENDACSSRTAGEALDVAEAKVSAIEQLADAGLHGGEWARGPTAQVEAEVEGLLRLMESGRDCGSFGAPGTLNEPDSKSDGGTLGPMQGAELRNALGLWEPADALGRRECTARYTSQIPGGPGAHRG
eukprot:CAMPEP_0172644238 /NCGR_PEP_ID=MMETSP1068-20121228/239106_1 /TAXON_ID=35684 /ORGANISM="Pseudopedinella elastica, Strain CCMP716" /LENGTH=269 /DNA_ID=CAMNT_0013458429 /DNA_START=1409 /DNA_END=2214 /DNA_ORIENTATION=+